MLFRRCGILRDLSGTSSGGNYHALRASSRAVFGLPSARFEARQRRPATDCLPPVRRRRDLPLGPRLGIRRQGGRNRRPVRPACTPGGPIQRSEGMTSYYFWVSLVRHRLARVPGFPPSREWRPKSEARTSKPDKTPYLARLATTGVVIQRTAFSWLLADESVDLAANYFRKCSQRSLT